MTNRNVYDFALHALSLHRIGEDTADLEERAPYLLAACCSEAQELDNALRQSLGQPIASEIMGVYLDLDATFPLSQCFATPAGYYLAAMLIVEEDPELSDKLYAHYCDGMTVIQTRLDLAEKKEEETEPDVPETVDPWTLESIGEAYFFN